MLDNLDISDLTQLSKHISKLTPELQSEFAALLKGFEETRRRESANSDFLEFVKFSWPGFIEGRHHKIMAEAFQKVAEGKLKRLIINMPPRHTKSEFASYLLPAWYLGRYPDRKVIQASHTADLSVNFGRKVRNLVGTKDFQTVFPGVALRADSKAAGRWNTNKDGEYFAIGVGGALAGRGAHLMIIDDPHSEQDAITGEHDPKVWNSVWEWYTSGPRQRLQPSAAIVIVMTRWHKRDLTGLIVDSAMKRDQIGEWEIIELPAILESGNSLWPEYWPTAELEKLREEQPPHKWAAQYQQNPTAAEGALLKREWWKRWEKRDPPEVKFIIQSWDTAYLKTQRADHSACTTWGVFDIDHDDGTKTANIILIDSFKKRMEFHELKQEAMRQYKLHQPDACIIEAKAAGSPLVSEFRHMGIPVQDVTPRRGQDKFARVNSISDIFRSGLVWAPDTRWADEVIEQCHAFPHAGEDDLVDTVTMALQRYRQGGFIRVDTDEEEDKDYYRRRYQEFY